MPYGSEWHLLRYLGRHRHRLHHQIREATGGDVVDWLDYRWNRVGIQNTSVAQRSMRSGRDSTSCPGHPRPPEMAGILASGGECSELGRCGLAPGRHAG